MCGTCGCSESNGVKITKPGDEHSHEHTHDHTHGEMNHSHNHSHHHHHDHSHDHSHGHEHAHNHHHEDHDHSHSHEMDLEIDVLRKNNLLAERNRGYFDAKNILTLNMVSSPGSGKTTLLEKTIKKISNAFQVSVIEGDQQTMNDAERIKASGAPVVQINTGSGCHLDADMINKAVKELQPEENSVLIIENVGNLVCPSMFDLGESFRVVIISTTEGEDKPLKYPNMFESSNLCIINKTDLLPYVDFDVEKAKEYARKVNHHLEFIELSAKTEEGLEKWIDWIQDTR